MVTCTCTYTARYLAIKMVVLGVSLVSFLVFSATSWPTENVAIASFDPKELVTFADEQLRATAKQVSNTSEYPSVGHCPECSYWDVTHAGSWVCGFFVSSLLNMYNHSVQAHNTSAAAFYKDQAVCRLPALEPIENDTGTHDVGFMMFYTYGRAYELMMEASHRNVAMTAAASLATRYSPIVGCIRSWGSKSDMSDFQVIIDNLMNLELLFWASEISENHTYREMAVSHADHTIHDNIRQDGCSIHVIQYDPKTGKIKYKSNHPQGLYDNSTWARGQAWAMYGFTMAYRYTRLDRYLAAAQATSDCFLHQLAICCNNTKVPFWDFSARGDLEHYDTSAGAIASSALIELSHHLGPTDAGRHYFTAANEIMTGLSQRPQFLATAGMTDAVLLKGVGTYGGKEVDVSLIYGDYFFIEALLRLLWL